jgi:hypothetical protein
MSRSPLLLMILKLMRIGLLFCAGSVLVIFAIEVWKDWFLGADHEMQAPDFAFLGVLVAVFAGALALTRSVAREIRKMETIGPENHR